MALHIESEHRLVVRVPHRASERSIQRFINNHSHWIEKKRHFYRQNPGLPESQYKNGGYLWLLGQRIDISVTEAPGKSVALTGNQLKLAGRNISESSVKSAIEKWKRDYARNYFEQLLETLHRRSNANLPAYTFSIRKMKRQWGNCSRTGHIKLNLGLIRYPEICIEHVIWHELCHLKYMNHGPRFYALLEQLNPDWRDAKELLKRFSG